MYYKKKKIATYSSHPGLHNSLQCDFVTPLQCEFVAH